MALKRNLNPDERFGLTEEEIKISEKFLRKNKTAGAVPDSESMKLYELFMLGYSFNDIQQQYPQYPVAQIILTAALRGWCKDREKMNSSLRDRIQAKVVKSIIEQVDFLTTMLSVTNVQHMDAMRKYILDPANNPVPAIIVQNIKEYKEVAETLHKLVAGVSPGSSSKKSAMMDALTAPHKTERLEDDKKQSQTQVLDIRELDRANVEDND
jgi:hypothetical protein